jgi:hypothetical protein
VLAGNIKEDAFVDMAKRYLASIPRAVDTKPLSMKDVTELKLQFPTRPVRATVPVNMVEPTSNVQVTFPVQVLSHPDSLRCLRSVDWATTGSVSNGHCFGRSFLYLVPSTSFHWTRIHVGPLCCYYCAELWVSPVLCVLWCGAQPRMNTCQGKPTATHSNPEHLANPQHPMNTWQTPKPTASHEYLANPQQYLATHPPCVQLPVEGRQEEAHWLSAICKLLEHRLTEKLRFQAGSIYSVQVSHFFALEAPSRKGTLRGDVAVQFTCSPGSGTELGAAVLQEVAALQDSGPTEEEVLTALTLERRANELDVESNSWWLGARLSLLSLSLSAVCDCVCVSQRL